MLNAFVKLGIIKRQAKYLVYCLIAVITAIPYKSYAATVTQVNSLSFGQVVTRTGSCEMDPTNGNIVIGTSLCLGATQRGHYQVSAAANTRVRIRLHRADDDVYTVSFEQKFILQNDYGTSITGQADIAEEIITGSDGIINIYVGGILNINQTLPSATAIQVSFTIEHDEI
ncbi:hypothetical protein C2869_12770 [Saccharobesus litoralis]|uniref:Uncharacterized protein n=1 Tax=Saccharobesus litoralis TaxID=2172099 RepID=A0A2S0VSR6_9ALTE|nr:DUF4402 domain-containing protein [Saccharobesus litoralis]AWB67258.1 hypothetical protein C2869_12770 [Saccharobesus litoralis]